MSFFKKFLNDKVALLKKDGTLYENIEAGVQTETIFIADVSLPIEQGDKIKRGLPSGIEEIFVVTDPGFHAKFHSIPAHYQIRYEHEGKAEPPPAAGNITYNVSGSHSRVNINSLDKSVNIDRVQINTIFEQIRTAIQEQVVDSEKRECLLAKVEELQQAHGREGFLEVYKEFMGMLASHATVVAHVVPALNALL